MTARPLRKHRPSRRKQVYVHDIEAAVDTLLTTLDGFAERDRRCTRESYRSLALWLFALRLPPGPGRIALDQASHKVRHSAAGAS